MSLKQRTIKKLERQLEESKEAEKTFWVKYSKPLSFSEALLLDMIIWNQAEITAALDKARSIVE